MDEQRNEFWFTPEMLEARDRTIWLSAWRASRLILGADYDHREMKEAYTNYKAGLNKGDVNEA